MIAARVFLTVMAFCLVSSSEGAGMDKKEYRRLTEEEARVIVHKGTEAPFTGEYYDFFENGAYRCKRCNALLYLSDDKFSSSCGWPSFDDEVEGAVRRQKDADGIRTEILCANCGAHLGHVFEGEGLTAKDIRHCVNSISLTFVPDEGPSDTAKAYFAGGCFWGVEYFFEKSEGVVSAVSGYMGGDLENPTYADVSRGDTGHLETVEVTYDPGMVSFEELARLFFEIHDPTQSDGQGPDIGEQYLSAIFYSSEVERVAAGKLIDILKRKGYRVETRLLPAGAFWKAEEYHQDYYGKNNKMPYCHKYQRRF